MEFAQSTRNLPLTSASPDRNPKVGTRRTCIKPDLSERALKVVGMRPHWYNFELSIVVERPRSIFGCFCCILVYEMTETAVSGSLKKSFQRDEIIPVHEIGSVVKVSAEQGNKFLAELAEFHGDETSRTVPLCMFSNVMRDVCARCLGSPSGPGLSWPSATFTTNSDLILRSSGGL